MPSAIRVIDDITQLAASGFISGKFPRWNGSAFEAADAGGGINLTRAVIVDQGGLGDYTTIKAACDYVATQSPGATTPWFIYVMPGVYTEAAFTVPGYTYVIGEQQTNYLLTSGYYNYPLVTFSGITSGNLITLGQRSGLLGLGLYYVLSSQTGSIRMVYITGASQAAHISGCSLNLAFAGMLTASNDAVSIAAGNNDCVINNCLINTFGLSFTPGIGAYGIRHLGKNLFVIDSRLGCVGASGFNSVGLHNEGASSTLTILDRALFQNYDGTSGHTTNIVNVGGTVRVAQSLYTTYSGTITDIGASYPLKSALTAAATTPGNVVKKLPIYDATGALLGYIPIYDAIT